jgi:hypothetical protein
MISPYYWKTYGVKVALGWVNQLWWRWMPGTEFKVQWPNGPVTIDEGHPLWDWTIGPSRYTVESADPNEHYRPEIERRVGMQGWDWDWCFKDGDISKNLLTIKFRRGRETLATYFALKWS